MPKKKETVAGFDIDRAGIRAVKAVREDVHGDSTFRADGVAFRNGPFATDQDTIAALREVARELSVSRWTRVVSCISGKDVFVGPMEFRRLPDSEMSSALRFEMRKSIPFDIASSIIDYQVLPSADAQSDRVRLMVSVVARPLLETHLALFAAAGLKPDVVDVLPLACGNVLSAVRAAKPAPGIAQVALHISQQVTVVVVDGDGVPFLSRSIYFDAAGVFGPKAASLPEQDQRLRAEMLIDEISRTLAYYESTCKVSNFGSFRLLGEFASLTGMSEFISKGTGLAANPRGVFESLGWDGRPKEVNCDVAAALAMRN